MATLAAALGAACLTLVVVAPLARAGGAPLTIYNATGTGEALDARFAIRPSIFNPLLEAGFLRTYTTATSQAGGGGQALSAMVYPGNVVVGGAKGQVGCGGIPGSPWVEGDYPEVGNCRATQESHAYKSQPETFGSDHGFPEADAVPNAILDRTSVDLAHSYAHADANTTESDIQIAGYDVASDPQSRIVHVDQIQLTNLIRRGDTSITHESRVEAHGVSILGGVVTIGTLISDSKTSSDGIAPTASASMVFSDVEADVNGTMHAATIDGTGIHVTDAVDHRQNLQLTEQLDEELAQAHVLIAAASPNQMVQGTSQASASEGGLILAFGVAIPDVPYPSEIVPVMAAALDAIQSIQDQTNIHCASDVGVPEPVCFGVTGILPGPGSQFQLQFNLAGTTSDIVGASDQSGAVAQPQGCQGCGGLGGPNVLGTQFQGPSAPPPVTGGTGSTPATVAQPRSQLYGLVARMPSSALAIAGAVFLVLALALLMGPSLRDARAG